MDLLEHLAFALDEPRPIADLDAWLRRLDECPCTASIDRAAWAGSEADRLGYAFVGGYEAALGRLLPRAPAPARARRLSLAATEAGGAHPRAIETRLDREGDALRLRGVKTFATLASIADELLVIASRGAAADGKNMLALVRVRASAPGVTIEDRAPTPFAPEIPHARVTLDVAVRADDVLPGDGYSAYLKPFRTIEDAHVLAATLGYVARSARTYGFGGAVAERALALLVALRAIGDADPSAPANHLALAGAFAGARDILARTEGEWPKAGPDASGRWIRDVGLLSVAEVVRQKRTEAAWNWKGKALL